MKLKITSTVLLFSAIALSSSCGSKSSGSSGENTTTDQAINSVYQCPMKCEGEKTYTNPGSCPVCNMDLKETEQLHEHHMPLEHDSSHANP